VARQSHCCAVAGASAFVSTLIQDSEGDMQESKLPDGVSFKECVQIGVIVADLEKSIEGLSRVFGIGPFRVIDWPPPGRTDIQRYYHDASGDFTARMAFTEIGSVELELIQPVSGASIWADFLAEHGPGIHHIRFNTYNMDAVVQYLGGQGVKVAQMGTGIRPGTKWANFASEDVVGFVIEVMQAVPGTSGRTPYFESAKQE
jgi:methylmalonyl-CoA/ethylmalonyl-CoA epimerase